MPQTNHIKRQINIRKSERGNVFLFVLIGVVLFGALGFTMSRSFQSETTGAMSERELSLVADEILSYAQKVERTVNMLRRRHSCSESEISFENDYVSGYEHDPVARDECKVFHSNGGNLEYKRKSTWASQHWAFIGNTDVIGVGTDCTQAQCSELMVTLPDIPQSLCEAINSKFSISTTPTDANITTGTKFQGSFTYEAGSDIGDEDSSLTGITTRCLFETSSEQYNFYHVLIAR